MKNQALFSSKDKSKKFKFKCRLLQFLFGVLRVKCAMSLVSFLWFSFLPSVLKLDPFNAGSQM